MSPPRPASGFRRRRPRAAVLLGLAAAAVALAGEPKVKFIELKADPPKQGKQTFNFLFAPTETRNLDKITFECPLQQELDLPDPAGGTRKVVREPTTYTYHEDRVRFVKDLDKYISFMVLVDPVELRDQFGPYMFKTNAPVTVPRIKVTAFENGREAWQLELPVPGRYAPTGAAPAPSPSAAYTK